MDPDQSSNCPSPSTQTKAGVLPVEPSVLEDLLGSLKDHNAEVQKKLDAQSLVMKDLLETMRGMHKFVVLDHSVQPLPKANWNDEKGWASLYQTALAESKEIVNRWKDGLDVNLIFLALFVTVITAFQTPIIESLSPDPADKTNELLANLTEILVSMGRNNMVPPSDFSHPDVFRPEMPARIINFFWSLALVVAILTAMLTHFGRLWNAGLTRDVQDESWMTKALFQQKKNQFAKSFLGPLMDSLQPLLIVSIALFSVGLLYQWWHLSFPPSRPVRHLAAATAISTFFVILAVLFLAFTLYHGTRSSASPYFATVPASFMKFMPDLNQEVYCSPSIDKKRGNQGFIALTLKTRDPNLLNAIAPMFGENIPPGTPSAELYRAARRFLLSGCSQSAQLAVLPAITEFFNPYHNFRNPDSPYNPRGLLDAMGQLYLAAARDVPSQRLHYLKAYVLCLRKFREVGERGLGESRDVNEKLLGDRIVDPFKDELEGGVEADAESSFCLYFLMNISLFTYAPRQREFMTDHQEYFRKLCKTVASEIAPREFAIRLEELAPEGNEIMAVDAVLKKLNIVSLVAAIESRYIAPPHGSRLAQLKDLIPSRLAALMHMDFILVVEKLHRISKFKSKGKYSWSLGSMMWSVLEKMDVEGFANTPVEDPERCCRILARWFSAAFLMILKLKAVRHQTEPMPPDAASEDMMTLSGGDGLIVNAIQRLCTASHAMGKDDQAIQEKVAELHQCLTAFSDGMGSENDGFKRALVRNLLEKIEVIMTYLGRQGGIHDYSTEISFPGVPLVHDWRNKLEMPSDETDSDDESDEGSDDDEKDSPGEPNSNLTQEPEQQDPDAPSRQTLLRFLPFKADRPSTSLQDPPNP